MLVWMLATYAEGTTISADANSQILDSQIRASLFPSSQFSPSMSLHCVMPLDTPMHTRSDDADSDSDSDYSTHMSLDSFSEATATSRTSVDLSMRSQSPAPSVLSVTSSLRAQAYVQEYGRGLNNYSDVYRLPADDEELDRLGKFIDHLRRCRYHSSYR